MAHTSEIIEIDGTKVKVAIGTYGGGTAGQTRTVNVYDHTDTEGNYQEVYRLPEASGITAGGLSRNVKNLHELDRHLMAKGAVKEGPRTI